MNNAVVTLIKILLLAVVYYGTGKLSLLLAIPPGFATPVWPAAGIALAAILLWGYRCLPGVFLGSFATNLLIASQSGVDPTSLTPILVGAGIAIGAVLQAAVGTYLVRRVVTIPTRLEHVQDIIFLLIRGGLVSCIVNAMVGPLVLLIAGVIPSSVYAVSTFTWWAGDVIGVILFAPMLLLLANAKVSRIRKVIVSLPILLFVMIAVITFLKVKESHHDAKQYAFDVTMRGIASEFEKDVQTYLNILTANERFINASSYVSNEEFLTFTRGFLKPYPSIQSLSWNRRITHDERKNYEKEIRDQGFPNFAIKSRIGLGVVEPSPKQDIYFPVTYIAPYEGNRAAHGFDTYSSDKVTGNIRQKTLDQARDQGRPITTGRISIVQAEGQYGLLIYNPVYSNDLKTDSVDARRRYLIGYTAGVFIMPTMLSTVATLANQAKADFVLYDMSIPERSQLLYDSRTPNYQEAKNPIIPPKGALSSSVRFYVAGHQWKMQFIQKDESVVADQGWNLWYLLIGGLLLSATFGIFLMMISAGTEAIRRDIEREGNAQEKESSAFGLAIFFTVISMVFAVSLWKQFTQQEQALVKTVINEESAIITQDISSQAHYVSTALRRMAQRWQQRQGTPKDEWLKDAQSYLEDFTGLTTVEWVDDSYHVRWIEPLEGNEKAVGLNIAFNDERKKALKDAANINQITLTPPLDLVQGYRAVITYVPLHIDNKFDGFIVGIQDTDVFFNSVLSPEELKHFHIRVMDGEKLVFENTTDVDLATSLTVQKDITLLNRKWSIFLTPKIQFIKEYQTSLPSIVLLGGVLFSLLIGFAVYTAILSNQRSKLLHLKSATLLENEKKLQSISEKLSVILDNAGEGIYGVNAQGHTIFANNAAIEMLGYSLEDMLDVSQHELIHHHHADGTEYPQKDCNIYAAFKDGKSYTTDKEVFWKKDGTALPIEYTSKPIRDEKGDLSGAVVVFRDISERRQAEKEREALIDKLSDSNEDLARFAYVCSHDLQEPLRMVKSFSDLLKDRIATTLETDEEAQLYFNFINDGAAHAQQLVSDILDYSSVDRDTLKPETFAVDELIQVIKENMSVVIKEQEGSITHDELPTITGNKTQIYQLLQNLVNNGFKYQKSGNAPHVHISVQDMGEHWQFAVKDNGIGMEERYLSKVFEVFQRLHGRDDYAGTGVGLSICKKVVKRHGGTIWVESELGKGSTFLFTLLK